MEHTYKVCIGEVEKLKSIEKEITGEEKADYQASLKVWDKADRAVSHIMVKTVESKVMRLLMTCQELVYVCSN